MPAISKIDLTNGIEITGSSIPNRFVSGDTLIVAGSLMYLEGIASDYLQNIYEKSINVNTLPSNAPQRQNPPILGRRERLEGNNLITTTMYIKVHLFSKSPLKFTVICSNGKISNLFPVRCMSKLSGSLTI